MTQLATDFQECDVGGKGRLTLAEYKAMVGRHEVRGGVNGGGPPLVLRTSGGSIRVSHR